MPKGVDLEALKKEVIACQPDYNDPQITDCAGTPFEVRKQTCIKTMKH